VGCEQGAEHAERPHRAVFDLNYVGCEQGGRGRGAPPVKRFDLNYVGCELGALYCFVCGAQLV